MVSHITVRFKPECNKGLDAAVILPVWDHGSIFVSRINSWERGQTWGSAQMDAVCAIKPYKIVGHRQLNFIGNFFSEPHSFLTVSQYFLHFLLLYTCS